VMADDGSGLWGSDRYLLRATFEAAEAARDVRGGGGGWPAVDVPDSAAGG
jgi:hypothetical protein